MCVSVCVLSFSFSVSFFYLRSVFAAATPRKEKRGERRCCGARATECARRRRRRRRRRKTTQKNENENDNKSNKATRRSILEGGTCWGELEAGTNWLQRKKKYKVSLYLLISVAGHARDVAPGLEHDFGYAGRKCIVSSSTATAAAAGGPHAGGALVPFNSGVELFCGIVIFMCCCCCSHDSSG